MLDAADNEPCTSDAVGALQFDSSSKLFTVCDGSSYVNVLLAGATAQALGDVTAQSLAVSGTGGLVVPAGTDGQRPSNPAAGTIRYNSEQELFEGFAVNEWKPLGQTTDDAPIVGQWGPSDHGAAHTSGTHFIPLDMEMFNTDPTYMHAMSQAGNINTIKIAKGGWYRQV